MTHEHQPRFLKALCFAAARHQDQRRKDERRRPYINHPIEVMEVLHEVAGVEDLEVLSAALLHDTIEDTETTAEELRERFGGRVCELVLELTDDKSKPKLMRKHLQIAEAPKKSPWARHLVLADKICNLRDLVDHLPLGWSETRRVAYFQWAKQVVDQIRGTHEGLESLFDQLYGTGIERYAHLAEEE